jgi:hypothetical protein
MTDSTIIYAGPARDRRRSKRILTARNAMWTVGVLVFVFAVVSIASEFRKTKPGEHGRLYERRELSSGVAPVVTEHPVIAEAPVREETFADPLNLDTINRQVVLGVDGTNVKTAERDAWLREQEQQQQQQATTIAGGQPILGFSNSHPDAVAATPTKGKARFAITGGAAGVSVAPGH